MLKNKNFRFNLGLVLLAGLAATTYSSPKLISNLKKSPGENPSSTGSQTEPRRDRIAELDNTLTNGTYLYGQSNLPEQIGREYLVFKVKRDRVVGAIYYPRSEFACFYGKLSEAKMNLFIIHPYDRNINPYSIPLNSSIASTALVGYQQIENISDNDRRILNTCLEDNLTADRI